MGADLGSASAEILINTAKATSNIKQLESSLRGLSGTQVGTPNASGFTNALGQAKAQTQSLSESVIRLGPQLTAVGGAMAGFGAIVLGAFGFGVKAGVDFESQMAAVSSVSGATKDQLSVLREEAIRLGADTVFSATESATAMEIMLKAGASLEDVMGGATEQVLNLAAATGTDVPLAAETASAAVNVFSITYEQAADTIAQASNASALDVNDFALAMKSAGPAAKAAGYSFQDMAGSLVILGDAGIKGEVAATALRNIIQNLGDSTNEGTKMLADYGIATRDAAGNMKTLDQITGELVPTWNTLTGAEKQNLAIAIAGKDGYAAFMTMMDAQTESVEKGSTAWQDANKRMAGTGTAAEQAAARMDSVRGSIEQLKGVIESIAISFTAALLPGIRAVVDALTGFLRIFLGLPSGVQTAIAAVTGLVGAFSLLAGGALIALPRIMELRQAFLALRAAMAAGALPSLGAIFAPLLVALAIAGVAILAFKQNWFGFGDAVRSVVGTTMKLFSELGGAFKTLLFYFDKFSGQGENPILAMLHALDPALSRLIRLVPELAGPLKTLQKWSRKAADGVELLGDVFTQLRKYMNPAAAVLGTIGTGLAVLAAKFPALSGPATFLADVFNRLSGVAQKMGGVWTSLTATMNPVAAAAAFVGVAFARLAEAFPALSDILNALSTTWVALAATIQSVGNAFGDLMKGDISGFFRNLGEAAKNAWETVKVGVQVLAEVASALWDAFVGAVQSIDWGAVGSALLSGLQSAMSWLADIGADIWNWISGAISHIDWARVWDSVQDATGWIIGKLGDLTSKLMSWVSDAASRIDWGSIASTARDITGDVISRLGVLAGKLMAWVADAASAIDWGSVASTARDITLDIIGKLGDLVAALGTWVGNAFSGLGAIIASKVQNISLFSAGDTIGKNLVNGIGTALGNISWDSVGFAIGKGLQLLVIAVGALVQLAAGIIKGIASALISGDWGAVASAIGDALKGIWRGLTDGLDMGPIVDKFNSLKRVVSDIASVVRTVVGVVGEVASAASKLRDPFDAVRAVMNYVVDAIEKGKGAADLFADASGAVQGAWDKLKGIIDGIVSGLQKAVDLWNKLTGSGAPQPGKESDGTNTYQDQSPDDPSRGNPGATPVTDPQGLAKSLVELTKQSQYAAQGVGQAKDQINAMQAGTVLASAATTAFNAALAAASTFTTTMATTVAQAGVTLTGLGTAFVATGTIITVGVAQWITVIGVFPASVAAMGAAVGAALTAIGTGFVATGAILLGAVVSWIAILGTFPVAVAGIGASVGAALTAIGTAFVATGTLIGSAMTTMASVVSSMSQAAAKAFQSSAQTIQQVAQQTASALTSAANSGGNAWRNAITSTAQAAQAAFSSAASQIRSIASQTASAMGSAGTQGGNSFANGVRSGMSSAVSAASSGASQIRGVLGGINLYGEGVGIGTSLGQGIAAGIASMTGAIAAQAAATVSAAVSAAKAAAAISSPSRVMMEVGKDFVAGAVIGIQKTTESLANTAAAMMMTTVAATQGYSAAPLGTSVLGTSLNGALGGRTSNYSTIRVVNVGDILVQDAGDPQATAEAVMAALYRDYDDVGGIK